MNIPTMGPRGVDATGGDGRTNEVVERPDRKLHDLGNGSGTRKPLNTSVGAAGTIQNAAQRIA